MIEMGTLRFVLIEPSLRFFGLWDNAINYIINYIFMMMDALVGSEHRTRARTPNKRSHQSPNICRKIYPT
jgi:hypothetical protein